MKFNFLKILNSKSNNPEEIAEQIVALEQERSEYAKQQDLLRAQAKELRQKKLCDEPISDDQVREADRRVENARLDSEAVTEGIVKLEERLRETYEAIVQNANDVAGKKQNALLPERNKLVGELAKAKARLLIVAEQLFGRVKAEERLRRGTIFESDPDTDPLMKEEEEKLRASMKYPTYYEKITEIQSDATWASALRVDEEVPRVLDKCRRNMAVPIKDNV